MDAVTLTIEPAGGPTAGQNPPEGSAHYRATLHYQRRRASFPFFTGPAWEREPAAREVLESVLSDAGSVWGAEDVDTAADMLADEYGADGLGEPSELRQTARACLATARKVDRLLGADAQEAIDDPAAFVWKVTDDPPDWTSRSDVRTPAGSRWAGRVGTHRDGYPVRVEIELRALDGRGPELSICASTPYSGGQAREELDGLDTYAEPWTAERIAELRRIWEAWHLNGMQSACVHQRALGWTYETHAGKDCPTCGYRIGSAWLYEPLPADVLDWLEKVAGIVPPALVTS